MEPWAGPCPLGQCDLNSGEIYGVIERKVLIWDGRIGGQWAVCGASLALVRCRVNVMKFLNCVVGNGGHTIKMVKRVSVPDNTART